MRKLQNLLVIPVWFECILVGKNPTVLHMPYHNTCYWGSTGDSEIWCHLSTFHLSMLFNCPRLNPTPPLMDETLKNLRIKSRWINYSMTNYQPQLVGQIFIQQSLCIYRTYPIIDRPSHNWPSHLAWLAGTVEHTWSSLCVTVMSMSKSDISVSQNCGSTNSSL